MPFQFKSSLSIKGYLELQYSVNKCNWTIGEISCYFVPQQNARLFFSSHVCIPEIFFSSQAAHILVVFPSYILPAIIAR